MKRNTAAHKQQDGTSHAKTGAEGKQKMKYVIFSDVHGNQYALRQMIQDTQNRVQGYWYLGDTSGYYYGQKECMELLQSLPEAVLLKGNHDSNYVNSRFHKQQQAEYAEQYGNSYLTEQGEQYSQWLKGLSFWQRLYLEGVRVGMYHGSVADAENGRIYPDTAMDEQTYADYDIVLQGHTHYRMARRVGKTLVLNPGSLGQPRDGKGFSYCVLELPTREYKFCTVQFEKKALLEEIIRHGETEKNAAYLTLVLTRGEN